MNYLLIDCECGFSYIDQTKGVEVAEKLNKKTTRAVKQTFLFDIWKNLVGYRLTAQAA